MDIEDLEILKEFRKYNKIYKEENKDLTITITLEAKESIDKAIERLLTDYEQKCNYIKENEIYKKNLFNSYEEKCKELEKEKEKNKEYNMGIKNLISQIESAIDFMKTDKSKIKVDMYKQKEEDLKLEIIHLKKLLKEE